MSRPILRWEVKFEAADSGKSRFDVQENQESGIIMLTRRRIM